MTTAAPITAPTIIPVILCGGSGTRLWPLSRQSFPKQFAPLIGGKSLLQLTLERVCPIGPSATVVASAAHQFLLAETIGQPSVPTRVILEPHPRNTAPAMALAALLAQHTGQADQLLLFCPADHHIPDADAFRQTVRRGIPAAQAGAIVTFGIVPSFPSTAYGYIQQGPDRGDGSHTVNSFIEKPPADRAQQLLLAGNVFWNAGIFLCSAHTLLAALAQHAPDILAAARLALPATHTTQRTPHCTDHLHWLHPDPAAMAASPSQSIDYAVLEHHKPVALVPYSGAWSDVGSWNAVADLHPPQDTDHNRLEGHGLAHHSRNTFIYAPHRPVVALGTQDLLIIDTPDAVLVAHRSHAEHVKDVVTRLNAAQIPQATDHRRVRRPWGWYDSIDRGDRFQVKRIGVKPGASISLQKHHHRAEHWVVVKGTAEVTCGDNILLLSENQSTYIPIGTVHRLRNPGKLELEIIEVQSGSYLGEDDIVRLQDTYGRVTPTSS